MTIAKKYEDVVAERDDALAREAALREELYTVRDLHAKQCCVFCNDTGNLRAVHDTLQQRLTVAEQRAGELEALLLESNELLYVIQDGLGGNLWSAVDVLRGKVFTALKPAAEPDHICEGCGSKGWTANCAQCVPY